MDLKLKSGLVNSHNFFDLNFKTGLLGFIMKKIFNTRRGVGSVGNSEGVSQEPVGKSQIFPQGRHFPHALSIPYFPIGSLNLISHTMPLHHTQGEQYCMGEHLHKRLDDEFVRTVFQKYISRELSMQKVLRILGIQRSRFFALLKVFRQDPEKFHISYHRRAPRRIDQEVEKRILQELLLDKQLIDDEHTPLRRYNYSYTRDQVQKATGVRVSLPTIINRAKQHNFYIPKKPHKAHDREVLTNYPGELIQHDSSYHRFSPHADNKWYLITSIDDFSRFMLYGQLLEKELSWYHIRALEDVMLTYGIPLSYYVDCHSIFRFVQGRDSVWREHKKLTDQVIPQWKQVLMDVQVQVTYALSPQAKGKVERPYQWLQDRLVRTCARENIHSIEDARKVLQYEINQYNFYRVHSTTREIPALRFNNAMHAHKTMFREFKLPTPFESTKDIFCLRLSRTVDAYHNVRINNFKLKVQGVPLWEKVEIRFVPEEDTGVSELRFWYKKKLVDVQRMKTSDIDIVQF
jgi:hypothetical protein